MWEEMGWVLRSICDAFVKAEHKLFQLEHCVCPQSDYSLQLQSRAFVYMFPVSSI